MATARFCNGCLKPIPLDAPNGLCPDCLASRGGDTDTKLDSGVARTSSGSRFIPPTPGELAKIFLQLEILEMLGQGGMGMVYKARQPHLDRLVALKILPPAAASDPAFAERFAREARALARLNHPNIVAVYDFGRSGDYYYFIMEYVDGMNLRQLEQSRKLTPREALTIIPKICEALQYAHDEGVVHRDIKPGNILLDRKGRPKIADFGLAKLLHPGATDLALTLSQQVMGTPHYMAPEQIERPLEVDHRADIYSLGVVLYEMLTGELPIGRFAAPSEKAPLDARLDEVVLRTLENKPERRFQRASDLKTELDNISGIVEALPPNLRKMFGFEFRSKWTLFGLPLVHIANGIDPATGRGRVAKGIIAVGDTAKGVIAWGGKAYGGVALGGVAVGLIAIGGCNIGVICGGGLGVALVVAFCGVAIAPVATGAVAVGYYALGGAAWGAHALGGNAYDAAAERFFKPWIGPWLWWLGGVIFAPFVVEFVVLPAWRWIHSQFQRAKT